MDCRGWVGDGWRGGEGVDIRGKICGESDSVRSDSELGVFVSGGEQELKFTVCL